MSKSKRVKNIARTTRTSHQTSITAPVEPSVAERDLRRRKRIQADKPVVSIDPHLIDGPLVRDRLASDISEKDALFASMEFKQIDPVVLRASKTDSLRYQVISGQRRIQVAKKLNRHIRAQVFDWSDDYSIRAQVEANAGRKNLTFIERSSLAYQLDKIYGGQEAAKIMKVHPSLITKMKSVVESVSPIVIDAIGAATFGRPRWEGLMDRLDGCPLSDVELAELKSSADFSDMNGNARFAALESLLASRTQPGTDPTTPDVEFVTKRSTLVIKVPIDEIVVDFEQENFCEWLLKRIDKRFAMERLIVAVKRLKAEEGKMPCQQSHLTAVK